MTTAPRAGELALADELMTVLGGVRRITRQRLRDLAVPELSPQLSAGQVELLLVVEESPGIGVAAAAARLHLAANSVSALVNQLLVRGLLRRDTDPVDRRAVRLHLSGQATARLRAWRSARALLVGGRLAGMSTDDRDALRDALPALRRLADALAVAP